MWWRGDGGGRKAYTNYLLFSSSHNSGGWGHCVALRIIPRSLSTKQPTSQPPAIGAWSLCASLTSLLCTRSLFRFPGPRSNHNNFDNGMHYAHYLKSQMNVWLIDLNSWSNQPHTHASKWVERLQNWTGMSVVIKWLFPDKFSFWGVLFGHMGRQIWHDQSVMFRQWIAWISRHCLFKDTLLWSSKPSVVLHFNQRSGNTGFFSPIFAKLKVI